MVILLPKLQQLANPKCFVVPLLINHVGDNNKLIKYMTVAVIARATNWTLYLNLFFNGLAKLSGGEFTSCPTFLLLTSTASPVFLPFLAPLPLPLPFFLNPLLPLSLALVSSS